MTESTTELATVNTSPMELIRLAVESGADPDRIEKLMNLQERWEAKIAAERYNDAIAGFQANCPQIQKKKMIDMGSGKGPKFASLDDIMTVIQPLLREYGLTVKFSSDLQDRMMHCTCTIQCGSHKETSEVTLPVPSNMPVNDTQKMGAALQYSKRYALCAALNIVVTDDDKDGAGLLETITEDQLITLREMLGQLSGDPRVNEAGLTHAMQIPELPQLAADRYQAAVKAINNRIKKESKS